MEERVSMLFKLAETVWEEKDRFPNGLVELSLCIEEMREP